MIQATGYVIHSGTPTSNSPAQIETFLQAVNAKRAKLTDIDDWVERWHTGVEGVGLELREYLGFSRELYASWMRNGPDALMGLMK